MVKQRIKQTKLAFFFHISGNIISFIDSSNVIFKDIVTGSVQVETCPCDLLESNDFIIDNISLFVTKRSCSGVGLV